MLVQRMIRLVVFGLLFMLPTVSGQRKYLTYTLYYTAANPNPVNVDSTINKQVPLCSPAFLRVLDKLFEFFLESRVGMNDLPELCKKITALYSLYAHSFKDKW